jgi:hypothetical protein
MLIDVAISGDRNVIKEENEKILKYKYVITEIQCMWNVTTKQIPVIRVNADKSLARPGRKQATATKLGIYLT